MLRTLLLTLFLVVFSVSQVFGQALPIDRFTPALPTTTERHVADVASWATVITAMVLDVHATIGKCDGQDQCYRAITMTGVRVGVTVGAAAAIKALVHRQRPCAPSHTCGHDADAASFYSMHTALAWQTMGGPRLAFVLPLAISTGGLRVAADKHWLSDVLVGAGVGAVTSRIR